MQFGIPEAKVDRVELKPPMYDKVKVALETVDDIFVKIKTAKEEAGQKSPSDPLTKPEREFFDAYDKHWVHAKNRILMFNYISSLILRAVH